MRFFENRERDVKNAPKTHPFYFVDDSSHPNLYILSKHCIVMSRREDFVTKSVRPWGAKATPLTTYFAEIGDTPYGKYGDYREKINIGSFPVGMHEQLRLELLNSNNIFESVHWGGEDMKLRQIISE